MKIFRSYQFIGLDNTDYYQTHYNKTAMKKSIFSFIVLLCIGLNIQAQQLNVATYNLRNANRGDSINGNGWGQRYPVVAELVQFHDFDIFGTQECKHHQLQDLIEAMPQYTYIGVGRDDGKQGGEYAAIFYKKDKFKLIEHGDFWLSTETTYPNKGWDAALPRICTWGIFKEKRTGFKFMFFNLHMDHIGVEARKESAKLILAKIKETGGKLPVILTGDFNVDQTNESYKLLNESGILHDSYEAAKFRYATNGTFNSFNPNLKTNSRIDHIFISKPFTVQKYGVLTDTYRSEISDSQKEIKSSNFPKEVSLHKYQARTPSDHFPVMVILNYKK